MSKDAGAASAGAESPLLPPAYGSSSSHPLSSMSFMLEASLSQFQLEMRQHIALLVHHQLSLTDFLSYSPFLSYSTLQGLLCFSAHRLNEIVTFLMRCRDQPISMQQIAQHAPAAAAPSASSSSSAADAATPAPQLTFAEPAKQILILRTVLILASHLQSPSSLASSSSSSSSSSSASINATIASLLQPSPHSLPLSPSLCQYLEQSALSFFLSPLPVSPRLTRWTSFVHLVTGHEKRKQRQMRHVKAAHSAPAAAAEEEAAAAAARRAAENESERQLTPHDRLVLLTEEMQQLWAAVLGLLTARCDRAEEVVGLFLPHLACALPKGGKDSAARLMRDQDDAAREAAEAEAAAAADSRQQQQELMGSLSLSLPSLPSIPLPTSSHPLPILVALIRSLSLLQLSIASRAALSLSQSLVSTLSCLFTAKQTANATKRELALCLSSLLSPLSLSAWSPSVSYRQWFALTHALHQAAVLWIKRNAKAKNAALAAPLLVSSLCCCDPEAFVKHFTDSIQSLLLSYHHYRRQQAATLPSSSSSSPSASAASSAAHSHALEASSSSISSLQQLLHVYLLQRSSRHETTLTNLEHIHASFLLSSHQSSLLTTSDEDGYSWMKGQTQDGLVALILTTAKADRNFAAHEIVLPMLESQTKRRREGGQRAAGRGGAETVEGVSGQVVTGLRALSAILCVDDGCCVGTEEAAMTNNKQPSPQLSTVTPPTSLASTLAALRSSFLASAPVSSSSSSSSSPASSPLSFYNPHAVSGSSSYLHRLRSIIGTLLIQCDAVVGHLLLLPSSSSSPSSAADDEDDERLQATTAALRLVLRVMTVIWPAALPISQALSVLVRACLHADAEVREGSRRVLLGMMRRGEDDAEKQVQRGRVVLSLVSNINLLPSALASSSTSQRLLSELLGFLHSLLSAWLQHSTFGSQSMEGLLLHEVEAAVSLWLAAVHPAIRVACIAVLLMLRALCHHLQGQRRHSLSFPCTVEDSLRLASISSPSSHHLMDVIAACQCFSSFSPCLSYDSLLPNTACAACGCEGSARGAGGEQEVIMTLTEQLQRDEAKEKREKEREDKARHSHHLVQVAVQEEDEDADDEDDGAQQLDIASASSSSALSQAQPISLEEATVAADDDNPQPLSRLQQSPLPLASILTATSEWRWSMLLSHWLRALVTAAIAPPAAAAAPAAPAASAAVSVPSPPPASSSSSSSAHAATLPATLSTLSTLLEQRLQPFQSALIAATKKVKGKAPADELPLLAAQGLSSPVLAVCRNWALMVVVAQSASFASSSASFLSRQLVPLLSSPFAVIRRMAAMAIGNAHPALFPSVLRLLQPLESDLARPGGGGRAGRTAHRDDSLRIHLSHIYRLFAESQSTSSSASSSAFSSRVLVWVQESYAYLSITGNEFRWDLMELRRHFCVVVERAALSDSLLDDSGRRVLFSLLLAWCGYGPSSASYSSKVDRHAEELLRKVRGGGGLTAAEKVAALKSSYALEMKTFRLCALSAMAALLKSPCFDEQLTAALSSASAASSSSSPSSLDGVGFIFPWLNAVLISADAEVRDVAYKALEHFLLSNERQLAGTLLDHCYHHHSLLARRYFLVIAQLLLIKCQTASSAPAAPSSAAAALPFGLSLPPLLHLLIFKLGDPSYNVRSMSLRLLPTVEHLHSHCIPASASSASSSSSSSSTLSVIVGSHLADTYKQVQLSLSSRLACTFSALSDQLVLEGCRRLHSLRAQEGKTQLLVFLAPWLRNIRLVGIASPAAAADDGYLADEHWLINGEDWEAKTAEERAAVRRQEMEAVKATSPSLFRYSCYPSAANQRDILSSLLQLTHQHSAAAPKAVEQLWTHLASSLTANVPHVLAFLLSVMQDRQRDEDFTSEQLPTYKRIALYCSRASPRVTVWKMLQHIYHGDCGSSSSRTPALQSAMKGGRGRADDSSRLRVSHFALLLLVEVAYEIDFSHYDAQTAAQQQRVSAQRPSSSFCSTAASCQATFDVLAVLLHIGVLGLSHALPFIRHHSAILLINIVHATAFKAAHQAARVMFVPSRQTGGGAGEGRGSLGRSSIGNLMLMQEERTVEEEEEERAGGGVEGGGALHAGSRKHSIASTSYSTLTAAFSSSRSRLSSAPSAGLSLAIAESQQMRVLGLRQRRALLLMNKLNSAGRSSSGHDSEEQLQDVVTTLLRVVPDSHSRATLSRRWQHHAVSWGVGSPSVSYRVQSHRIYRALSPPLVSGHYWKCVVALEAGVKQWREEQGNGQSLYQTLRSLQLMVERLHDGSASAAPLRSELLPCLLWSCVSVLHSAFSQPLRGDCSLLVLCIEVLSSLLAVVRDDTRFEQAVYDWRRRRDAEREQREEEDDGMVFVGIQPLLMRCLLPAEISVYASFPCLNMITASAVVLTSASASAAALSLPSSCPPPPSPQLLKAIFGFLAAFTPQPASPLAPLLDISSFAQRMLVSLITQLPFMLQALDSSSASASPSAPASSSSPSLPCSHAPPHLSLSASPELVTSCQSFASLFSGLGLLDLAMTFACCSCGHYPSSHSFLSALSQPLLQVLPASVVVDVCLLLCDVMERMGAFVAVDAAFHSMSTPRPARVYSRPVLTALQSAAGDGSGGSSGLSHYVLTLICLLFSHVDWPASQLSSASSSPLFTRLHMLLHTAMAPLAAQALTIALHRADSPSPPSTAHQYAACIIQPAAAPAASAVHAEEAMQRYAPNPKLSTRLEDDAQDDVVKVVMAAADKRDSGALLQVRDARPLPSAPPEMDTGSSSDDSGDDEAAVSSRPPQYHQRVPPPSSAPSPSLCPLSPPPPPPPPKRPSGSAAASLQAVKASMRRERNSSLTVDVSITIPMDAVDEGDEEEKKSSAQPSPAAVVNHLVKDRPRIAAVRKRPSLGILPGATAAASAPAPPQPERAVLKEVQLPLPQPPIQLQAEVKTVKVEESRRSADRKEDRRSSGGRQSASRTSAGRGSSSSSAAAESGRSQAEAAAGRPVAKRSTMMALMLEQRDRKRREEQQRRDVAYHSLLREQQSIMQHVQQQQQLVAPAPPPPATAAAAAKPAVVRTPPRMSSPAAAIGGGDRAAAGGDSADVGSAVREEKRRRDAEWAKVKERRHGIRERMREVGVKEREKDKDRQQQQQQAVPDWQRQSVLPCTFHLSAEDEDSSAVPQQQQPRQVSMEDIMAGRVNYQ